MKKYLFCFILCILGNSFHLNAKECSCGSFQAGLYDYSVVDNSGGCCSGIAQPKAFFTTYVYSEGAWEVADIENIAGGDAQKACCGSV